MAKNNNRVEVFSNEPEVSRRIDELRALGVSDNEIYVIAEDKEDSSPLASRNDINYKSAEGSFGDKFTSFLSGKEPEAKVLEKFGLSESEKDEYAKSLKDGKILLYTDSENATDTVATDTAATDTTETTDTVDNLAATPPTQPVVDPATDGTTRDSTFEKEEPLTDVNNRDSIVEEDTAETDNEHPPGRSVPNESAQDTIDRKGIPEMNRRTDSVSSGENRENLSERSTPEPTEESLAKESERDRLARENTPASSSDDLDRTTPEPTDDNRDRTITPGTETDNLAGANNLETDRDDRVARETASPRQDADTDKERMELHEEKLDVDKNRRQAGEVEIDKHTVKDKEEVDVPVTKEEVTVERRPVNETDTSTTGSNSTKQGDAYEDKDSIRVPVHEEEVEVNKKDVVKEEIVVNKKEVEENVHVDEDVRREEADITDSSEKRRSDKDDDLKR